MNTFKKIKNKERLFRSRKENSMNDSHYLYIVYKKEKV